MAMDVAPRESAHVYKREVLFLNAFMPQSKLEALSHTIRILNEVASLIHTHDLMIWESHFQFCEKKRPKLTIALGIFVCDEKVKRLF